ncbi:serum amyloid A-5 protein-like [Strongylocentrotus purpuratus]|uniref:Serum amyloid A protein n=1 Tax=Strongylocentrotus purpuratus TaxID=7668 RepID=A0A7M7NIB8_STRPU|nr:serum amyloid A-5 protein-like [Strongylocentrotus purpuratus]
MRISVSIIALLMVGVLVVPSDCCVSSGVSSEGSSEVSGSYSVSGAIQFVTGAVKGAWDFVGGARDMWRSYSDMREANYIGADKYFHARGNYEASQRGPGGRLAAKLISDGREVWLETESDEEMKADHKANMWGRNGGDPNVYRPEGLPDRY